MAHPRRPLSPYPPSSFPNHASLDSTAISHSLVDLKRPAAPFMANPDQPISRSSSSNSIYRTSVAANMTPSTAAASSRPSTPPIPSFRAPFLAPSSRPGSSLWSPPVYNNQLASPNPSITALPLGSSYISKTKPPLPSTRLVVPIDKSEKPWLSNPERGTRISYWSTLLCILLGLAGAAILCWQGVSNVLVLDQSSLCLVLSEDFSSQDLDTSTWTKVVELGGFGNAEFQMTTDSSSNLFLSNNQLYIMPTLTSDTIPLDSILDGGNFTLQGCTSANQSACSVDSNKLLGTVINPVQSAKITTQGKKSITFGKVQVRAKLPRGYITSSPLFYLVHLSSSPATGYGLRYGCCQRKILMVLGPLQERSI